MTGLSLAANPRHTRTGMRVGPVGVLLRRRALVASLLVLVVLAALILVSLVSGTLTVPLDRIWATLTGHGTAQERLVVVDRRLVRAAAGTLIGFALGMAGALTQSITRNPIATPDILGVTSGASAFAVLVVVTPGAFNALAGGSAASLLPLAAAVGGLLTTAVVLALAWRGGFDSLRLILVGIGVNAVALAAVDWMLTRTTIEDAAVATRWLVGSLSAVGAGDLAWLAPVCGLGLLVALVLTRDLGAIRLGPEVSSALGTSTARVSAVSLFVAVVLASVATAAAGPIGFVAFVAPQAAMRLFRTAGPPPLAAGLTGAALLVAADLVGQRLPTPLPVGVVTAVIGAPCLLYLLISYARRTSAR